MKLNLKEIRDQANSGVIISRNTWLRVLDRAIELEDLTKDITADSSNWVDYDGSGQPVSDNVVVEIECIDKSSDIDEAGKYCWDAEYGIIRYRIKLE